MNLNNLNIDQQEIWNTLLTIDKALVQKDSKVFEQLLSSDFIGAIPTGAFFSKDAYIKHHCNNSFGVTNLIEEDINNNTIRIYNNTAVVNRRAHAHFKLPTGNTIEYDVQRIEVLVKTNNQWIMVSGQGTQVMPIVKPQ